MRNLSISCKVFFIIVAMTFLPLYYQDSLCLLDVDKESSLGLKDNGAFFEKIQTTIHRNIESVDSINITLISPESGTRIRSNSSIIISFFPELKSL